MIFLIKKTIAKKKEYNINTSIGSVNVTSIPSYEDQYGKYASQPLLQNKSQPQELLQGGAHSTALTNVPVLKKEYPLIIKHQFPRWLRDNFDREETASLLIKITEYYYEWLSNEPEKLNDIDLFYLDKNIDIDRTNSSFLEHLSYSYINSFPSEQIIKDDTGGYVTLDGIRNFFNNIKVNLYQIKSTAKSFLYTISNLLEIDANKIRVLYPKQYILRLNGGRFPWMSSYGVNSSGEYNTTNNYYPSLGGSILNRSVIQDNNFWQDYSYLIDTINENNATKYEQVVAPLLHPAGMKYFFETGSQYIDNIVTVNSDMLFERPIIANYALYKLTDNISLYECTSCAPGSFDAPTYRFPSWDCDIKQKITAGQYPPNVDFGSIYIGDFLELRVCPGSVYPNDEIADCSIAGCI